MRQIHAPWHPACRRAPGQRHPPCLPRRGPLRRRLQHGRVERDRRHSPPRLHRHLRLACHLRPHRLRRPHRCRRRWARPRFTPLHPPRCRHHHRLSRHRGLHPRRSPARAPGPHRPALRHPAPHSRSIFMGNHRKARRGHR